MNSQNNEAVIYEHELVGVPNNPWYRQYGLYSLLKEKGAPIDGVVRLRPNSDYVFTREDRFMDNTIKFTWYKK